MTILTPKQSLKKAFLKVKHTVAEIEHFKQKLHNFFNSLDTKQSEENNKNDFRDLLLSTHYSGYSINTDGRIDLALKEKNSANLQILFEVKRPSNTTEMITDSSLNRKAMQEILYYYLQELHSKNNTSLKQLIITNCHLVYIFDAQEFYRLFGKNSSLKKEFLEFEGGSASGGTTEYFYTHIAPKYLQSLDIECTKFSFDDYKNADDKAIVELYKILSPEHLLKLPFANDSNTLNTKFYSELLHIIGLEERAEKSGSSKKIIARKEEGKRNYGSILENCLLNLNETNELDGLAYKERFGDTQEEIEFAIAMELCIVWINRILFLKLLEGQLVSYNNNSPVHRFLNSKNFPEYDSLKGLFFGILAHSVEKRSPKYANFSHIPYLNSSLFEPTPLEVATIQISSLSDNLEIPILSDTVLKDASGTPIRGNKNTLEYLYEFLDAYDFSSNASDVLTTEKKTLINASVLGLIFEKINGYKDGSFFTPGFITMYMCRETIERAMIQRFNEHKGWKCQSITDVINKIEDRNEANDIFNSITICDPAVGSGHFLVSSLNELIALKFRMKILTDRKGEVISKLDYDILVENDELIVLDSKGNLFQYNKDNKESQRIQETMFHEKQMLIERCLFGVDINENSVKICRLRLWIELLKYAYYRTDGSGLETLPNLDIKIKTGNSLLSRFPIDIDLKEGLRQSTHGIEGYKAAVQLYKKASSKKEKDDCLAIINQCKSEIRLHGEERHDQQQRLNTAVQELHKLNSEISFVEPSPKEKKQKDALEKTIATLSEEITNWKEKKQYANAFEWRFEFPEILDTDGNFLGFDIIIGNPPYMRIQGIRTTNSELADIYLERFESATGAFDLYILFVEQAHQLIKQYGIINYIMPFKWVNSAFGVGLRKFILQQNSFTKLISFEEYQVFNASTYTGLHWFEKDANLLQYTQLDRNLPTPNDLFDYLNSITNEAYQQYNIKSMGEDTWTLTDGIDIPILHKIENQKLRAKDIFEKIFQGIATSQDSVYFLHGCTVDGNIVEGYSKEVKRRIQIELGLVKPILKGDQVHRYEKLQTNIYVVFPYKIIEGKAVLFTEPEIQSNFPLGFTYLKENEEKLRNREKGLLLKDEYWFKYIYPKNLTLMNQKKLFCRDICSQGEFSIDLEGSFYTTTTVYGYIVKNEITLSLQYLLALMNSKVIWYYLTKTGTVLANGFFRFMPRYVERIPIPQISEEKQRPFEELVEQILTKKERGENTDVEERRIDEMVYSLYHLTPDEINHIEGKE